METLTPLDYESGVSCELTITVFDGRATSDPETLTIDIGDVDEPPVMSNTAYVISTEEVVVRFCHLLSYCSTFLSFT